MTALCHAEFALSEADYFLGVLHSEEKAAMAYDGWLVGHARWFRGRRRQKLLDALRRWADTRERQPMERCTMICATIMRTISPRTGSSLPASSPRRSASGSPRRRLLICWPVVLLADFLYLVVFYRARLFSDALLQIFFVAFTLYGWWHWWRGVREEGEVRVVRLSRLSSLLVALAQAALGSFVLGALARRLHAALPHLDAALTSYSLVASWWQARKHIANWWLWIVVDLVYIGEYIYKDLLAHAYALCGACRSRRSRPARLAPRRATAVHIAA